MADESMRTCKKCGNTKPIDEFDIVGRSKKRPDGFLRRTCKACGVDSKAAYVLRQNEKTASGPVITDEIKICTGCGQGKPTSEFYVNRAQPSGLSPRCKCCIKAYQDANREAIRLRNLRKYYENHEENLIQMRVWRKENPEIFKACKKAHYKKNRDSILEKKRRYRANPEVKLRNAEYMKKWIWQNKERMRRHEFRRYHTIRKFDPHHIISNRVRKRMITSLKESKAGRSWESLVGYTVKDLEKHLRKTIPAGYTWDDFMAGKLHIDHRVPLSAHHFTSADDIDFKKAWSIRNLQLLPASVNCSKGAKLDKPFQPSLTGI